MISKRQEVLNNCWIAVNSNDYKVANEIFKNGSKRYGRRLFGYWLRLMITNGLYFEQVYIDEIKQKKEKANENI